jgi:hypothetical protein
MRKFDLYGFGLVSNLQQQECVMSENLRREIERHLFELSDDALRCLADATMYNNFEYYMLVKREILARLGQLFGD